MLTASQIREILAAGTFDRFVGETKTDILECKREPYRVEQDRGALELAKDVSSLANANGGFIIIGLDTERAENSTADVIRRARPLKRELIDDQQHEKLLNSWLVPRPSLSIGWYPSAQDADRGLFVINIHEQAESAKPFLIARLLDSSENRIEMAFGFAERRQTNSQPTSVREMYQYFRDGRRFSELIESRFAALEAKLGGGAALPRARDIIKAIAKALEAAGMLERRTITLVTYPNLGVELKTIFNAGQGTIRWHLEHPPEPRYAGWDLKTLDNARIVEGELIRVRNGDRKLINLYRDGTIVFAAAADDDFYCWGRSPGQPKINSLALIEAINNFVFFYARVIDDFSEAPQEYSVVVDFRNLRKDGIPNYMMPHSIRSYAQQLGHAETYQAPSDHWRKEMHFTREEILDAGATAYRIVREIYLWFGMDETMIPYKQSEGERTFIHPGLFETA